MFLTLRGKHCLVSHAAVLSHPASRDVEELRVSADHTGPRSELVAGSPASGAAGLPAAAIRSKENLDREVTIDSAPHAAGQAMHMENTSFSTRDQHAMITVHY
jgi:hypothetical protein